jgi:hypothetical protein
LDASDGLGVFEGAGAIRRLFEDWRTAYEDLVVKPGTGVGDVSGEFMTPAASPTTDEMGKTWARHLKE